MIHPDPGPPHPVASWNVVILMIGGLLGCIACTYTQVDEPPSAAADSLWSKIAHDCILHFYTDQPLVHTCTGMT